MPVWQPDPGELLLARAPVMFATGAAPAVKGMRWFRDPERRDIQGELSGWPEGPEFTPRSKGERGARAVVTAVGRTVGVLVMAALTGGGGAGPDFGGLGRPQDPANEVDDFPVLYGAPDSVARTLPWQLDPARRPEDYRTHLVVTNRRVLITGFTKGPEVHDQVLWQADRAWLSRVEPKDFSRTKCKDFTADQCDVRVDFTDGSWCRLASNYRENICRHLTYPLELLGPEDLTPGQTRRVAEFVAERTTVSGPVVTRLPDFTYLIEVRESDRVDAFSGITFPSVVMDRNGEDPDV
ncbi:hypothetical protein SLNWT_2309 [Streptomyces albus]|uniref:Uncharacterized protein n=1 Tax=Streptomyces albus (strain ATCC 21838 / DSM 41398 / FERM P-419 / JCM 4703 / NBRC 107858) TaxID=1081613 RepID=A0A0B5ETW9_STRA4|nr:hypothetical protein SLNWT_2309 [Streptomyces albus]AOU76998.1 hypothetical protein SLNHY_2307 [Streptomyces albus]AYN32774.1 hypothetical protein DUI70_2271 [Streptomyces albus]